MRRFGLGLALVLVCLGAGCGGGSGGASETAPGGPPGPPNPTGGLAISPTALPKAVVGTAYDTTITTSGTAPFRWTLSGALPPGMVIVQLGLGTSTNRIRGTATVAGTFSFTVQVTDATGATGSQSFSLVACPRGSEGLPGPSDFTLSPASGSSLPDGIVGQAYARTVTVTSGGSVPFTFGPFGLLPPVLSVKPLTGNSFAISGTPTQAGTFSISVVVQDASQTAEVETYDVTFNAAPSTFALVPPAGSLLSDGTIKLPYSQTITVAGGTGPYTFTGVSLPPGISVVPGGANSFTISGTPKRAGSFTFQVSIQDAAQATETETFSVTVATAQGLLSISPSSLEDGVIGDSYDQSFTLVNGTGAVQWSVAGALPDGLSLSSLGNLYGELATAGSFSFTIQAVDSTGATALQSYTIYVSDGSSPPSTFSPAPVNSSPAPVTYSPPPANYSPPPVNNSPPPANNSPPPANNSVPANYSPPVNNSPPPANNSSPPANNSPPPVNNSPPPANNSPPPANNSPPPANNSPPPANNSPPANNGSSSNGP